MDQTTSTQNERATMHNIRRWPICVEMWCPLNPMCDPAVNQGAASTQTPPIVQSLAKNSALQIKITLVWLKPVLGTRIEVEA